MNKNAKTIWDTLMKEFDNPFGVAGLMGNLEAESGQEPVTLENAWNKKLNMTDAEYTQGVDSGTYANFVDDGAGYGLAQWTYKEHKQALLALAQKNKTSIGDLKTQLEFLIEDQRRFTVVHTRIKAAATVKAASDVVLTVYEKPTNTSDKMKEKRAALGMKYFETYGSEYGMSIKNTDFCAQIQKALDEGWGYIWGTYGQTWTEAKQRSVTDSMAQQYGGKWIGKRVADCSGLGYWAFNQLGGKMYHGSNTMWNEYVTGKCELVNGVRKDGQPMYPGDPVFIKKNKDGSIRRTHVGYYMGNGIVIEAQGTINGVCSNANGGKGKALSQWNETAHWKNMEYKGEGDIIVSYQTLRNGSSGEVVKELQNLQNKLGYNLTADGKYGIKTIAAVKDFQKKNGLTVDGVCGNATWTAVKTATEGVVSGIAAGVTTPTAAATKAETTTVATKELTLEEIVRELQTMIQDIDKRLKKLEG